MDLLLKSLLVIMHLISSLNPLSFVSYGLYVFFSNIRRRERMISWTRAKFSLLSSHF